MTDDELLASERERHGSPYMNLTTAKELRKLDSKFWHMRALKEKAMREAAAEAERALLAKLFPGPIAMADEDEAEYGAGGRDG
jgi:hypothetical protein